MCVDYRTAMTYVEAAKRIAAERGVEVSVAVLDAAGHPVVIARGKEDAWHGPYMAAGKARLAAAFRKGTKQLLEQWADRPMYPMSLTEIIPGGVTLNPGGYPIFVNGECIGAIGVGGGSPKFDDDIAHDAVTSLAETHA
jgi:glc operon protein GlcG